MGENILEKIEDGKIHFGKDVRLESVGQDTSVWKGREWITTLNGRHSGVGGQRRKQRSGTGHVPAKQIERAIGEKRLERPKCDP